MMMVAQKAAQKETEKVGYLVNHWVSYLGIHSVQLLVPYLVSLMVSC